MSELVGVGLLATGAILLLCGLGWLVRRAFQTRKSLGVFLAFTLPFGTPLIYGLATFRKSKPPLMLVLLGVIIGAGPFAYNQIHEYIFGLGERERTIDGELHIGLTGWDRPNYKLLSKRMNVAVLELGNADVTDATVELLVGMPKLRELTLNDSQVTDACFATIAKLPALESLRLARTKITRDGVVTFLAEPPAKLKNLDVSGNSIPGSAVRKWKNADAENRKAVY